jgi:NitT/TauT family transport system ATP-binding protein
VVAAWEVEIPRPRRMDSPEVATLSACITDRLRDEIRRHGNR